MAPLSFQVNEYYAQISELVPGLYICGVTGLSSANMKAFRIELIVNATREVPNLKSLGQIQRMKLWVEDTTDEDLFPHFDIVADQIHAVIQDRGAVLVHCVAGVSRSAAICLAYLLKYRTRSLRAAYHLMCSKRPMVRPNLSFWRQLIHYEQQIKRNVGSVRIVRDEAQPDKLLPDVYLKNVIPDQLSRPLSPTNATDAAQIVPKLFSDESAPVTQPPSSRHRRNSSGGSARVKFVPVLGVLTEMAAESAA
uniref:Protein-tyrosine-phosphatase n=1 Tax=Globodera rostochiensis TaxID=31243 RepID=A0A914H028_GLORO